MIKLAQACEQIAATTKKLEKIAIVAEYLKTRPPEEASVAAVFLSGRPFPVWEETTLQVGGRVLWLIVAELAGKSQAELTAAYRKLGDLGAVAEAVLPSSTATAHVVTGDARFGRTNPGSPGLSLPEIAIRFREIAAARGPAAKAALTHELLAQASPLEAKYMVKIMTGDLRIGLKESLVEEAIAKAYGGTLGEVQQANMLLGDIGETLKLAAASRLYDAKMRLFHPLGFMLASPAESPEVALSYFENPLVEDKYDGIRAQAHCCGGEVRIFSRTRDQITESFPELPDALAGLPDDVILDGEIVAWSANGLQDVAPAAPHRLSGGGPARRAESDAEGAGRETGRALPFSVLQQRLGRKQVSENLMRQVPVAYLVFDALYAGGKLLLECPLLEREKILDALLAAPRVHRASGRNAVGKQGQLEFGDDRSESPTRVIRAPVFHAATAQELDHLFEAAQARGNEGLMIKDPTSHYTPGRRGRAWLKLKRELATLDVVVTAVEYGHGKRIGVLSDYTFAVRDGEKLVNIGKAYSGLTDVEIAEMTKWFLEHTIEDQGFRLLVEPKIVLEVAFNNMMQSDRHESGYALRFPRIVRLRPDKLPEEADTIERAREIYEMQNKN
jgi:DNA ligase 1